MRRPIQSLFDVSRFIWTNIFSVEKPIVVNHKVTSLQHRNGVLSISVNLASCPLWEYLLFLSEGIWSFQVLDERHQRGLAGPLRHQCDNAGGTGGLGPCDAVPGLQADPKQRRMEAEPGGFFQHLGPQLPVWHNLESSLPGLWTSLCICYLPLLHPQLISRSVLSEYRAS